MWERAITHDIFNCYKKQPLNFLDYRVVLQRLNMSDHALWFWQQGKNLIWVKTVCKSAHTSCVCTQMYSQHKKNSNYEEHSASAGPVLLDWSFCSRRPSSGFLLGVGVCWSGDKTGATACFNTGGGRWTRRRGREESRETGTRWCVKQALPFPWLYLQPCTSPISSSRKLSGCNLPLALHW